MKSLNNAVVAICTLALTAYAAAQTDTTFTYQGELNQNGSPVTDVCDFRFELHLAFSGNTQVGSTITETNINVSEGRFAVDLDFSATAFDNRDRFLQIEVRCPAGSGGYTILNPRQLITRSPYSIQTRGIVVDENEKVGIGTFGPQADLHLVKDSSTSGDILRVDKDNGSIALTVDEVGNVGIGTSAPTRNLDVVGSVRADALLADSLTVIPFPSAGVSSIGNSLRLSNSGGGILLQTRDMFLGDNHTALAVTREFFGPGRIGIGTENPQFALHVDGDAGKPGGGSWSNASDIRLKKNVEPLDGALKQMLQLRGVTFEYLDPDAIHELSGERIGVIAQEVEDVFPNWVDERKDGYKAVTFRGFEALTVEALRELHDENESRIALLQFEKDSEIAGLLAENDATKREMAELRRQVTELKSIIEQLVSTEKEQTK